MTIFVLTKPKDDNVKSSAIPSSQSTATKLAVPSRKTFYNTAKSFWDSFGHSPKNKDSFHHSPKSQDRFGHRTKGRNFGSMGQKLCFVCYSPDHLIKDCDFHSEYLSKFPKTKRPTKSQWRINQFGIIHMGLTTIISQKTIGTLTRKDLFQNH